VKILITSAFALVLALSVTQVMAAEDNTPAGDGMVILDPSEDNELSATSDLRYFGVRATYFMWTQGRFSFTLDIGLNPAQRYLITGALTGKSGGNYGQVYISTICRMRSIDQIVCEVEDDPSDPPSSNIMNLGITRIIAGATRVSLTLRGDGGLNRAEGTIFRLAD
jgi:hypothetical protein